MPRFFKKKKGFKKKHTQKYLVKEAEAENRQCSINRVVHGDKPLVIHRLRERQKGNKMKF